MRLGHMLLAATMLGTAAAHAQSPMVGGVPVPLQTLGTLTSAAVQGQAEVVTPGTAVQLASNTLINGFSLCAFTTNTGKITAGNSNVTNTTNGTGNGIVLAAGQCWGYALSNTSGVWINGTASGDGVFFGGN